MSRISTLNSSLLVLLLSTQFAFGANNSIAFDSLTQVKRFVLENELTKEPIHGAIMKLSDPERHGVVFSYESDSLGQFEFDIQRDQHYYLSIQKEGFENVELKLASSDLESLKSLTLIKQIPAKIPIFATINNQLLQSVSFVVISPIETHLCWLYPQKAVNNQIVGFSHITFTQIRALAFLSY